MKALSTKALSTKALRALRYPTYQRLRVQRALIPVFGNIMLGVGNFSALGLDALHGSGSLSLMTAHIVTHVVIVVPIDLSKGVS